MCVFVIVICWYGHSFVWITEVDYLWKRNTAVLLYNQLSDHGEQKLLARMTIPYYNSLWRYFYLSLVFSNFFVLSIQLVKTGSWLVKTALHNVYCFIIANKTIIFCFRLSIPIQTETDIVLNKCCHYLVKGFHDLGLLVQYFYPIWMVEFSGLNIKKKTL